MDAERAALLQQDTMSTKKKPKLGQNFLTDLQAQRKIVDALGNAAAGTVVEIGPGRAAITALLAERATRLVAIELDARLAAGIRAEYGVLGNVEVIEADVLTVDLSALATEPGRTLAVVGNLPYYITSPILQHLFAHERVLQRAVVMVQREVADRMTAVPGTSEYGVLSVLCQLHAQVDLLFTLPPAVFTPPPEVHSSVVRMEFAPQWEALGISAGPFSSFLRECFAQKRKTLQNNLRAAGYIAAAVTAALEASAQAAAVRAEELSPAQLAGLFHALRPARD
jgi:16S rRNA (adenine1518-N6/adenine1519-N6)-dimethyltransferase